MEKREIIEQAKGTIGYMEAENKESFLVGAQVALDLFISNNNKIIEVFERRVENLNHRLQDTTNDLKTLAEIINRYNNAD